jgi:hypothetical protein
MKQLHLVAVLALSLATLVGCAAPGEVRPAGPQAVIEVERRPEAGSNDCPLYISVFNRTPGVAWDGFSYHIALRNQNGTAVGEVRGIPHRYLELGNGLGVPNKVQGVKCESLVSVTLLYFGIYPQGRGQVRLDNSRVAISLK